MEREPAETFAIVNIGGNVRDVPMTPAAWAAFQTETAQVLRRHAQLVGQGSGISQWGGVTEAFATFHLLVSDEDQPALRRALAQLAGRYEQDAIALVPCSESGLVFAEPVVAAA